MNYLESNFTGTGATKSFHVGLSEEANSGLYNVIIEITDSTGESSDGVYQLQKINGNGTAWIDTNYPALSVSELPLQKFYLAAGTYRFVTDTDETVGADIQIDGEAVTLEVTDPLA